MLLYMTALLFCFAKASDVTFSSTLPLITTSVPFIGRYTGDSSSTLTWTSDCQQRQISSMIEEFLCFDHGSHEIILNVDGDDQTYSVDLELGAACYTWAGEFNATISEMEIWINNRDGVRDNALTLEFHAIGEVPRVTLSCDKEQVALARAIFDGVVWRVPVELGLRFCAAVHITGIPVIFDRCTVAEETLPLYMKSVSIEKGSPMSTSKFKICKDYCGSGITVLLNGSYVLISASEMKEYTILNSKLTGKKLKVIDCGVIWDGTVLLLVDDGNTLLVFQGSSFLRTISLPFKADHITVNWQCVSAVESRHNTSSVILWSSTNMAVLHELEVTYIMQPEQLSPPIGTLALSYLTLTALIDSNSVWFTLDNRNLENISAFDLSVDCDDGCEVYAICPHTVLLVTSDGALYTAPSRGNSMARVQSHTTAQDLTANVKSIAISSYDVWALLSEEGTLYYGYCAKSSVLEIAEGFTAARVILFDSLSRLYYVDETGSRTLIPVQNILPSDSCQLRDFGSTISSSLLTIDKGEESFYNVTTATSSYNPPRTFYQVYPQGHLLVNITSAVSPEIVSRVNRISDTLQITGTDTKGMTVIVATPQAEHPYCLASSTDITYVVVECPMYRHIRVINIPETCDHLVNKSLDYTIPATVHSDKVDTLVTYDEAELGCPIIWAHDKDFLPEIWIYDYDEPVRKIDTDFVLREIHNRTDFNFSHSVSEVSCLAEPQTWETMNLTWNRDNYQPCFTESENKLTKTESDRKYQILNSTGKNMVVLANYKANYTFQLTVLDPATSYCNLNTKFAVWIVDAPNSSDLGIIVLFLSCFVMLGLLGLSYLRYKGNILSKANMVLQS